MCSWGFGCSSFSNWSCGAMTIFCHILLMWCYGTRLNTLFQKLISTEKYLSGKHYMPTSTCFFRPTQAEILPSHEKVWPKTFPVLVKARKQALGNNSFTHMWFEMFLLPFISLTWLDLPGCCLVSDSHDPLEKEKGFSLYQGGQDWLVRKSSSQKDISPLNFRPWKQDATEISLSCHILGFSHLCTFRPSASDSLLFFFFKFLKSDHFWNKEVIWA